MLIMCRSRKDPYTPHGRSLEIPKGRWVLKVKILEAKYKAKLEFPGERWCKTKDLPWGEYGYQQVLKYLRLLITVNATN